MMKKIKKRFQVKQKPKTHEKFTMLEKDFPAFLMSKVLTGCIWLPNFCIRQCDKL